MLSPVYIQIRVAVDVAAGALDDLRGVLAAESLTPKQVRLARSCAGWARYVVLDEHPELQADLRAVAEKVLLQLGEPSGPSPDGQ